MLLSDEEASQIIAVLADVLDGPTTRSMGPTATVERAIDNLKSVRDAGGVTCHQANAPGWRRTTEGVHTSDVGANPVDRGKPGGKLHLVCDGRGRPLTAVVTAANVNDTTMF